MDINMNHKEWERFIVTINGIVIVGYFAMLLTNYGVRKIITKVIGK